jgi:hypothetical protein
MYVAGLPIVELSRKKNCDKEDPKESMVRDASILIRGTARKAYTGGRLERLNHYFIFFKLF